MNILQLSSIVIEAVIVCVLLYAAIKKQRVCAWGMALTFFIYVFYDLARLFSFNISEDVSSSMFFVASLSALWAVLKMGRE